MALRVDQDVGRVLREAAAGAHRARHSTVTREHVLSVLIGLDAHWRDILPLHASRRELATLVSNRLSDFPTSAPYRDVSFSPPLSVELEADLRAARKGFFFPEEVGVDELLETILLAPEIARLVADARLELDTIDSSISRARRIALERRHGTIHAEHVFRALADERWFAQAIVDAGGVVDAVRNHFDERLAALPPGPKRRGIVPTEALAALIERARAYAAMLVRPATSDIFVVLALRNEELSRMVADAGIDPVPVVASIVHGEVPDLDASARASSSDGDAEVVFHNDDFTTQEFVASVLEEQLGVGDVLAVELMLRIHVSGEAVVGVFPETEARERARAALERAREAGFPLRVEVRIAGGGETSRA